jgi:hypothetical protein
MNSPKKMGFETTGIESSLGLKGGHVSEFVDHTYFIKDSTWGGFISGTHVLSPTSEAMVGVSDRVIGIGGNEVGRDELIASREAGKSVSFFSAEMNHELAIAKAAKKGLAAPISFTGAAQEGLMRLPTNLVPLKKSATTSAALLSGQGCVTKALGSLLGK